MPMFEDLVSMILSLTSGCPLLKQKPLKHAIQSCHREKALMLCDANPELWCTNMAVRIRNLLGKVGRVWEYMHTGMVCGPMVCVPMVAFL